MKPKLYLINGPLGAGKTTFLKELLRLDGFQKARVIENEFASTSIDTDQLHDHTAEIETIAGQCICCSTGSELLDALDSLSSSGEPVIIEATGMANSLKLVEKIVLGDMLDKYELAHAVFVLDGLEANKDPSLVSSKYRQELLAADTVMVSKPDLVSESELSDLMSSIETLGADKVNPMTNGLFDPEMLNVPSSIVSHFSSITEDIENHDEATNYSVVDVSDLRFDTESINAIWQKLAGGYGLLRMKGEIRDVDGQLTHVEATPSQCRLSSASSDIPRLVLIGERAREITEAALANIEGVTFG